jgi:hypothetical protein
MYLPQHCRNNRFPNRSTNFAKENGGFVVTMIGSFLCSRQAASLLSTVTILSSIVAQVYERNFSVAQFLIYTDTSVPCDELDFAGNPGFAGGNARSDSRKITRRHPGSEYASVVEVTN